MSWREYEGGDRSMDGPRGLSLLNDSVEEAAGAGHSPAKRRTSQISHGSSSTGMDRDGFGEIGPEGLSPVQRGADYVRSWLFTVRRLLTTYYFVMSFVLIFCFAIKVRVYRQHCCLNNARMLSFLSCPQACLELAFNVVTPLLQTVTVGNTFQIMFAFLLFLAAVAALATSNWVRKMQTSPRLRWLRGVFIPLLALSCTRCC